MAEIVVRALDDKKAENIKLLKTREVTVLADYFVICTANSTTQIKTLSDAVEKAVEERGEHALRREGFRNGGWVLVDFGCVVVHIFMDEVRKFYALEHLWSDAEDVDIGAIVERQ